MIEQPAAGTTIYNEALIELPEDTIFEVPTISGLRLTVCGANAEDTDMCIVQDLNMNVYPLDSGWRVELNPTYLDDPYNYTYVVSWISFANN